MSERRTAIVKLRLSPKEHHFLESERKAAGSPTRGKYLRDRVLAGIAPGQAKGAEIAEQLGRLSLAVNALGPRLSGEGRALAREVRDLAAAIRAWSET